MSEARTFFARMDKNGDRVISKEEFYRFYKSKWDLANKESDCNPKNYKLMRYIVLFLQIFLLTAKIELKRFNTGLNISAIY